MIKSEKKCLNIMIVEKNLYLMRKLQMNEIGIELVIVFFIISVVYLLMAKLTNYFENTVID
jgi:hypothetical protein